MNWGWRIAIVYTTFALMVLSFVFFSATKKVNLVEENYYEEEINYQDQIDRIKNSKDYGTDFLLTFNEDSNVLSVQYSGKDEIKGELHLFRPSDSDLDMKLPLNLDKNGYQKVDVSSLKKGLWVLKTNWSNKDKSFYKKLSFEIK